MFGKFGLITLAGFIAAASTSLGISRALAGPITYNETDIASGSLNGVAFTDATIVLNENSDTNTVTGSGIFENFGTVTLSINGSTPVTFTDSIAVVSNQGAGIAGFGDFTNALAILFDKSSSFSTYDLTTSIGPIVGTAAFNSGAAFATTGGDFILTSVGNPTFTATLATTAVPEPSSLAVFASAVAGFGFFFRRGRGR